MLAIPPVHSVDANFAPSILTTDNSWLCLFIRTFHPCCNLMWPEESYRLWPEGPGFELRSPRIAQARVRLATNTLPQTPHIAGALCTGYAIFSILVVEVQFFYYVTSCSTFWAFPASFSFCSINPCFWNSYSHHINFCYYTITATLYCHLPVEKQLPPCPTPLVW